MMLDLRRCACCFSTEEKDLKKCNACGAFAYCSRECQRSDWRRQHKYICKELSSLEDDDDAKTNNDGTISVAAPIIGLSSTHAGYVCKGKKIPAGVPSNFGLLQAAYAHTLVNDPQLRARMRAGDDSAQNEVWLKQSLGEVDYLAFYDDLTSIHHKREWTEFFQHSQNFDIVRMAHKILKQLADVNVKHKSYEKCGQVLDEAVEIMNVCKRHYSASNADSSIRSEISDCEHQVYDANKIVAEMYMNLDKFAETVPVFRDLCAYERKYLVDVNDAISPGLNPDRHYHLCILQMSRNIPFYHVPTLEEVNSLSDSVVMRVLKERKIMFLSPEKATTETQLMKCGNCNKEEKALGELKACVRCNTVAYCGRDCQKADWKKHKKVCNKK